MTKKAPSGRLVTDGDGHLFIQPFDDGVTAHIHDGSTVGEDGTPDGTLVQGLVEVKYDAATDGFVVVEKGDKGHNDEHHKQFAVIDGTHPDLYDDQGNLVLKGDDHHFEVQPDDPHFGGVKFGLDEHTAVATSHTEAWS